MSFENSELYSGLTDQGVSFELSIYMCVYVLLFGFNSYELPFVCNRARSLQSFVVFEYTVSVFKVFYLLLIYFYQFR